jgi:hypothetical protein
MKSFFVVKPVREDIFEGLKVEGKPQKPKKMEYFPTLTLEELRKRRVYLLFNFPQFFYEIYSLNLPVYNEEIVRLRLTDRVNTVGYLTQPFSLFWKILKKEGNFYELSYLAIENRSLFELKNKLKGLAQAKLEGIIFLPFALARALEEEKEEVFLLYKDVGGIWIIIAKESFPLNIEFFQIDELLGVNFDEILSRLNFLKNLYYRDRNKELTKVYLFQEELKIGLEKSDFELFYQEISHPDLLYAPLSDKAFNLLPENERVLKEVIEKNYKLAFGMLLLSLIFLASGFLIRKANSQLEREIQKKEFLLRESINRLLSEYPEPKVKNFINYLEERNKLLLRPQAEEVILKIIKACQKAKITNLEIKEANNLYQISLSGEKKGDPEEINSFSEELLKEISSFMNIQQNQFEYSEEKKMIIFSLSGNLK